MSEVPGVQDSFVVSTVQSYARGAEEKWRRCSRYRGARRMVRIGSKLMIIRRNWSMVTGTLQLGGRKQRRSVLSVEVVASGNREFGNGRNEQITARVEVSHSQ